MVLIFSSLKHRKALINTLVNKVYLFDEKMTILYNTKDGQSSYPFEQKGLPKGRLVEAGCDNRCASFRMPMDRARKHRQKRISLTATTA